MGKDSMGHDCTPADKGMKKDGMAKDNMAHDSIGKDAMAPLQSSGLADPLLQERRPGRRLASSSSSEPSVSYKRASPGATQGWHRVLVRTC